MNTAPVQLGTRQPVLTKWHAGSPNCRYGNTQSDVPLVTADDESVGVDRKGNAIDASFCFQPTEFQFEPTTEAAWHNYIILEKHDFNLSPF